MSTINYIEDKNTSNVYTNIFNILSLSVGLTITSYLIEYIVDKCSIDFYRKLKSIILIILEALASTLILSAILSPIYYHLGSHQFLNIYEIGLDNYMIDMDLVGFSVCLFVIVKGREVGVLFDVLYYSFISLWIGGVILNAMRDINNLWLIFLPRKTNLFYIQLIELTIYYYGTIIVTRPSFFKRFLGTLNVNVLANDLKNI